MRLGPLIFAAALAAGAASAIAAPRHRNAGTGETAGPVELGSFADWTAARYERDGQTVCYAFTRAKSVLPPAFGTAPMLTTTERPGGQEEVAITAPDRYKKGDTIIVQVGRTGLEFISAGANAYARDDKAAVSALRHGGEAIARGPGTRAPSVTDSFSLQGFGPAREAIVKACPAR